MKQLLALKNRTFLLHKNYRRLSTTLLYLCICLVVFSFSSIQYLNSIYAAKIQKEIASQILRFHVVANSDSVIDQSLKLVIKDTLTNALKPELKSAHNLDDARRIIEHNLSNLESLSNQVIKEHGFSYDTKASITKGYFPLKVYGDLSLPPGEYEAIRIELGEANGQNWWCIMYPPLCFVDSTYSVVPDSSKEQLKELLSEEEYDSIFTKKDLKIKIRLKLFSFFQR